MKLIVNADDFGRSSDINRAVVRAHCEGILTSASLMVAGEAADEAIALAREHPTLAVGLHLVIVDGPAVLPRRTIPDIVDERGWFADAPVRLGLKYAISRACRRQIEAELRAQFERFAASGLPLSHVDGHQHMHMHPAVFKRVLALAREFGARGIRIVSDDLGLALRHDRRNMAAKLIATAVFGALAGYCRHELRSAHLISPRRTYGFLQSGSMDERYVRLVLARCRGAAAEIYFHPTQGERLDRLGPNRQDLHSLLDPLVRKIAEARRLQWGRYADLCWPGHG